MDDTSLDSIYAHTHPAILLRGSSRGEEEVLFALAEMGLLRGHRLMEKKRRGSVVTDKFHLKNKNDTAFLGARNDRCALAAGLFPGAFVFLDSPKLGTTLALARAGVDPARLFPVNGCDEGGFCRKAARMGARPTVSMFDAAPARLEDLGAKNVQLCYNDGTHGDPDRVLKDMLPWLQRLPRKAYLSFTFALRSHNAVPLTGKFGLVIMLAQQGFEPPGGWKFLSSAFTFDGRVFNVHMTRGVAGKTCERAGLCRENGYSLGKKYETAKRSPCETADDLMAAVKRFLRKCPRQPYPMHSKTPYVSEWEELRRRICRLGPKGEKRVLEVVAPSEWVSANYRDWIGRKTAGLTWQYAVRFPKRLQSCEAAHWKMVGAWVAAGLPFFQEPTALLVSEMHPKASTYRDWVAGVLPKDVLRKTLCVGDADLTPGVKANTTRGRGCPGRVSENLTELLRKESCDDLFRHGTSFSLIFLPLFSAETYEEIELKIGESLIVAAERSTLVLSLRSASPLTTVAWMVRAISYLSDGFQYKVATFCSMREDGEDLLDYSRIATVVLSRNM